MKIQTKFLVLAVVLVVLVIALPTFRRIQKPEILVTTPDKIKIAYNINSLDTVPLMIAYQNGYFKDYDIEVELTQVTGSDGAVAVSSGKVDMVIIGAPRLFGPIDKGAPVKMISPMSNTFSELFVRPNSLIRTFKDLEGKKVSIGSAGGTKELFFKNILKIEGVDITKVNFVPLDNTMLHIALIDKKAVDAVVISDANFVDAAIKLGAVIMPEWQSKNYQTVSAGLVVAANSDFLKNHETNFRKYFQAIIKANRYLKNNLDQSAEIITRFYKDNTNGSIVIDPKNFINLVQSGRVRYYLWENPAPIVDMATISNDIGQIGRSLSESDLYDLRFKDMLEAAQQDVYGQK